MISGQLIGDYELIERHEPGEHTSAWRARDRRTDSLVSLSRRPFVGQASRFESMVTRLQEYDDPGIQPIIDSGIFGPGEGWLVEPEIKGIDLATQLRERGFPPVSVALDLVITVTRIVARAHRKGLFHGALSLDSILWEDGGVKLRSLGWIALTDERADIHFARDLAAIKDLVVRTIQTPPAAVRAVLSTEPANAQALVRALESVLNLPLDGGSGRSSLAPRAIPPLEEPEAKTVSDKTMPGPIQLWDEPGWGVGDDGSPSDLAESAPVLKTIGDHEGLDGEDSWGVSTDSQITPDRDSHGAGRVIHRVDEQLGTQITASSNQESGGGRGVLVLICLGLFGIGVCAFVVTQPKSPTPSTETQEISSLQLPDSGATAVMNGGPRDPDGGDGTVEVRFVPADVTVKRVSDGQLICEASGLCKLPIDVDYRAESPGHEPLVISGDDLYDRRLSGRWRLVLRPKTPEPKKKRRRRGRR